MSNTASATIELINGHTGSVNGFKIYGSPDFIELVSKNYAFFNYYKAGGTLVKFIGTQYEFIAIDLCKPNHPRIILQSNAVCVPATKYKMVVSNVYGI